MEFIESVWFSVLVYLVVFFSVALYVNLLFLSSSLSWLHLSLTGNNIMSGKQIVFHPNYVFEIVCLDVCEWKQTLVENRLVALALFNVAFLTLWGVWNQNPNQTHTWGSREFKHTMAFVKYDSYFTVTYTCQYKQAKRHFSLSLTYTCSHTHARRHAYTIHKYADITLSQISKLWFYIMWPIHN